MNTIAAPLGLVFTASSGAQPGGLISPLSLTSRGEIDFRFYRLADEWHNETDYLSSPTRRTSHPKYLKIIGLGRRVMPLILGDLARRGGDWYVALESLLEDTEKSPVPADANGNVRRVKDAWLQWGRARGML